MAIQWQHGQHACEEHGLLCPAQLRLDALPHELGHELLVDGHILLAVGGQLHADDLGLLAVGGLLLDLGRLHIWHLMWHGTTTSEHASYMHLRARAHRRGWLCWAAHTFVAPVLAFLIPFDALAGGDGRTLVDVLRGGRCDAAAGAVCPSWRACSARLHAYIAQTGCNSR